MEHKILLIDDQEDILRILGREFQKRGKWEIFTAANSRNALATLTEHGIDLVITDVRLGEENGFTLLKQMRERFPHLDAMVMTAYRSPSYRQQAEHLGVTFFIEKPFSVATLIQAVEGFFASRGQAQASVAQAGQPPPAQAGSVDDSAMSHFKAVDLIQLFCLNGRRVVLTLSFPGQSSEGKIYIREGRVCHVQYGASQGEEAFFQLMAQKDPQLGIRSSDEDDVPETVTMGWEYLLMEAARTSDEAAAGDTSPQEEEPPKPKDPFANFWKTARLTKTSHLRVPG